MLFNFPIYPFCFINRHSGFARTALVIFWKSEAFLFNWTGRSVNCVFCNCVIPYSESGAVRASHTENARNTKQQEKHRKIILEIDVNDSVCWNVFRRASERASARARALASVCEYARVLYYGTCDCSTGLLFRCGALYIFHHTFSSQFNTRLCVLFAGCKSIKERAHALAAYIQAAHGWRVDS